MMELAKFSEGNYYELNRLGHYAYPITVPKDIVLDDDIILYNIQLRTAFDLVDEEYKDVIEYLTSLENYINCTGEFFKYERKLQDLNIYININGKIYTYSIDEMKFLDSKLSESYYTTHIFTGESDYRWISQIKFICNDIDNIAINNDLNPKLLTFVFFIMLLKNGGVIKDIGALENAKDDMLYAMNVE